MSITRDDTGTATQAGGGATVVADFGSAPTEGDLLVCTLYLGSPISSAPTNWASAVSVGDLYIYWRIAGSSEPSTATWTMTGSDQGVLAWGWYTSTTGWETSPVDVTASTTAQLGVTEIASGTTGTTAEAVSLAFAGLGMKEDVAITGDTLSNSFTEVNNTIVEAGQDWSLEITAAQKILSATGTQGTTLDWTSPVKDCLGCIAVFSATPDTKTTSGTLNGGGGITAAVNVIITAAGTLNGGGSITAVAVDHQDQIARPASTITAGDWDTGPTTGQNLHTYAGDNSDSTYIEDTTA